MNTQQELSTRLDFALTAFFINSHFNSFALECVVMGDCKPNDTVCFDRFYRDLKLRRFPKEMVRDSIDGDIVNSDLKIVDRDVDDLLLEFFSEKMQVVFNDKCNKKYFDKHDFLQFDEDFRSYLLEVFYLFKQIVNTPIEYNFFETIPYFTEREKEDVYFKHLTCFVRSIKENPLRQGKCVDRYIKKLSYMPFTINNLLTTAHKRKLLKTNDVQSLEYKLAIISLIRFQKSQNYRIFELKMKKWMENLSI